MKLHESLLGCFRVVKLGAARPREGDGQRDWDFKTPSAEAGALLLIP